MIPDYLSILSHWTCPTCGNSLADSADHCGEEGSHLSRHTQGAAAKRLRELHRVADGADLDAALIAAAVLPRPAHRPRRDPAAARIIKAYRVHPDTALAIAGEATRSGESQGQVVDRLADGLPK